MNTREIDSKNIIKLLDKLIERLYPINRSITGSGLRETFKILSEIVPLNLYEIKSGTICYDWTIPKEWIINEAWIKNKKGEKIIDFKDNNLYVLNYTAPFQGFVNYDELIKHIYTLPSRPNAIPYRTSYYDEKWGFCMEYSRFLKLERNEKYEVFIDSKLTEDGSLTYADFILEGKSSKNFIISTYPCHPSLANDNLSGLILTILLAKILSGIGVHHNYRFIFAPETIGTIAYLANNAENMRNVKGGFVITTVAGNGRFGYKKSYKENSEIDRAVKLVLSKYDYIEYPFSPDGSDERQYSSPGFRIPVGTISKDKYYTYDEYHTSDDNLDFISSTNLYKSLVVYLDTITVLEKNRYFKRNQDFCEFQLSKYGLYPPTGGAQQQPAELNGKKHKLFEYNISEQNMTSGEKIQALEWLSFACDGENSLLDIAEKSKININVLYEVAREMEKASLIKEVIQK